MATTIQPDVRGDEPSARPAALLAYGPDGTPSRYSAPKHGVHPDRERSWWKRLLPLFRGRTLSTLLLVGTAVLSLALRTQVPKVTMQAFDKGLTARTESIESYAVQLLVMALVIFGAGYVWRYGLAKLSYDLEYSLRVLLFDKFMAMPFSYYDSTQAGQLVSRANSDVRAIQMFLQMGPMVVMTLVTFVVALYNMLRIDVLLTVFSLIALPAVFGVASRMQKAMFPLSWLLSSRKGEIASIVEENVAGAEVVRAFAAEGEQISIIDQAARRLQWVGIKAAAIRARYAPLTMNLSRLGLVLILYYGGHQVIHRELTLGAIVAFNGYVMMVQMPFMMLGMLLMLMQRAQASAYRIFEVLDAVPDLQERPGAVDLLECEGRVELRDVRFAYREDTPDVLDGATLRLEPGETVALVGRTGSGKSTVARLIARFYDASDGAVLVDGHDVRDVTFASLRSHVGLVLDDSFLFSGTIRDNIAFGRPDAPEEEILAAARAAGAEDFIGNMAAGYETLVGERGATLSGGQRQRIAIARTLLVNPRILVLDDCTSAIDPHREHEIHGALKTLMAGRTTLVVAHRPATISLANRVLVLDGGRIVADGTDVELRATSSIYREILTQPEHAGTA